MAAQRETSGLPVPTESQSSGWLPARSAGWGDEVAHGATAARALRDPAEAPQQPLPVEPSGADELASYPIVTGRVAYLDVPDGTTGVAALVKVATAAGSEWELQRVGINEVELLGALRVQAAKLEQQLRDRD